MKRKMLMLMASLTMMLLGGGTMVWAIDPGIADTARVAPAQANAGESAAVEVYFYNDELLGAITIPLAWDSPDITLDSVAFTGGRLATADSTSAAIENDSQRVVIRAKMIAPGSIAIGNGLAAKLYFSIPFGTTDQIITIDKTTIYLLLGDEFIILAQLQFTGTDRPSWRPQMVPGTITIGGGAVEGDGPSVPGINSLSQNYPNPFNPSTTIRYSLQKSGQVSISVFNVLGQEVKNLVNESRPAGENTAMWDGKDNSGSEVSSGVYFYRILSGALHETRKMMLVR